MGAAVTIETGAGGTVVMVEPERRKGLDRRVFKQVGNAYEWAHFADWRESGERARFYGWASNELPESMRTT